MPRKQAVKTGKGIKRTALWFWIAVLLWMLAIFGFSAQTGGESSMLSDTVAGVMQGEASVQNAELTFFIRKSAHFLEYFLLGSLLFSAFYQTFELKKWALTLLASAAGILYAASDEWHQAFVPGRSPRLTDVALDSVGVICGVFGVLLLWLCWQRRKKRRKADF